MTKESGTPPNGTTARRLLERTDTLDDMLFDCGRKDMPIYAVAAQLGCHKDTLRNFFQREPGAREHYMNGKAEARAGAAASQQQAAQSYLRQAHQQGNHAVTCPFCGEAHAPSAPETITVSAADIADSQARLTAFFREHAAAQERDETPE